MVRSSLTDVLAAWESTVGAGRIRKVGSEWHGPCPVCERHRDGCRLHKLSDTVIFKCRCDTPFVAMLAAVGLGPSASGGQPGHRIEPYLSEPDAAPPADPRWRETGRWPVSGPDGRAERIRTEAPGHGKRVMWEPRGVKPRRYLWSPRGLKLNGRQLVVCEGEKAAQASAEFGLAAVGTCTGEKGQPDPDVWTWLFQAVGTPVSVLLWPDADDVGRAHMDRIAATLADLDVAPVWMLDPEALAGGLVTKGWDAADWAPGDAVDMLAAVEGAADRWIPTGDWRMEVGTVLSEAGDVPESIPVVARCLLHERRFSVVFASPGAGKTSVAAAALAAVTRGEPWLGEGVATPGRVLLLTEEDLVAWTNYGRAFGADLSRVVFADLGAWGAIPGDTTSEKLGALIDGFAASTMLVDSLTDVFQRVKTGAALSDSTAAAEFGSVLKEASRQLAGGLLALHHTPRDGSNGFRDRMRDSGSLEASADVTISLTRPQDGAVVLDPRKRRRGIQAETLTLYATLDKQGNPTAYHVRPNVAVSVDTDNGAGIVTGSADAKLDARVIATLRDNQGISGNAISRNVGGRRDRVFSALQRLSQGGQVVLRGEVWYTSGGGTQVVPDNQQGTTSGTSSGTRAGTGTR